MIVGWIAWLDRIIHSTMIEIFDLIFKIAEVNIFRAEAIREFTNRIYGILGVIILFKIIISAIQYLISPDKLLDKDKGIGGLLQRTIISVALLALVPTIFNFAKDIQIYVSKAIPQIILGQEISSSTTDGDSSDTHAVAKDLSLLTLKVFIIDKATNKPAELGTEITDYLDKVTEGCDWAGMGDGCKYDYNWFFSILVGGFMIYIFLSMGIDIGIRAIKMGIIEILAPIPISSYINSEENFKAWYQTAFKVYADLFIRLIVIYFIVYVINALAIGDVEISTGEKVTVVENALLYIYIIIALLLFAKSAPKFICDILGLKTDGAGIGDMFKPAWSRAGALAAPLAGLAAAAGSYRSKRQWGAGKASSLVSALRSGVGATASGLRSAYNGDKASDVFKNSRDKARTAADKRFEFAARNGGIGKTGTMNPVKNAKTTLERAYARSSTRASETFDSFTGITTGAEQISREKAFYQAMLDLKKNEKKNNLTKVNALNGFVDNTLTMSGTGRISLTYKDNDGNEIEYSSYDSYSDFLQEYNGLQQKPFDDRSDTEKARLKQMMEEKDAVEKFMIKNQSYIALTNPSKDEGNYSAIAADVIKIARSGTKSQVDTFLEKIGGGDIGVGASILDKLTQHLALTKEEAIRLNKYIAGDLETDAQKGVSDTTARERTVPKGQS